MADDLSSHGISYSVSVDENMVRQISVIMISKGLECTLEVFLKNTRTDDLLSLLALRACLSVVLAHVFVVGCTKSDDTLLTLVANIDSNKHCLL